MRSGALFAGWGPRTASWLTGATIRVVPAWANAIFQLREGKRISVVRTRLMIEQVLATDQHDIDLLVRAPSRRRSHRSPH